MVFKCPISNAVKTKNTKYTRVELREMLRNGNKNLKNKDFANNWVFSTAKKNIRKKAAALDGEMTATLAINKVTTTGKEKHIGRMVIGQIHAIKDEPVKIYYRKLPGNELGSIYISHEKSMSEDKATFYEMVGKRSNSAPNPADGIALNTKFTYHIKVIGNDLWVTIKRDAKKDVVQHIDMSKSMYNKNEQFMYFKAGIYNINNSGEKSDYSQVTFYDLETSHTQKGD